MGPGQQLLQAPQLPLLLLTVLLLLLPLLLQSRDLGFIAADGVWQGRKGRGKGASMRWSCLGGANGGLSITATLCKAIHYSGGRDSDDAGLCGGMVLGYGLAFLHNVLS